LWLNASDEDVKSFIRIFTLMKKEEIESLESEHAADPGQRILQKTLARDITARVHSQDALQSAMAASEILFGKSTEDDLRKISEDELLEIFEGVPQGTVDPRSIEAGVGIVELLVQTGFMVSNGEARRALQENSISLNKSKVKADFIATKDHLLRDKYLLLQRGKKNYFLVRLR